MDAQTKNITINRKNFPDKNFRNYVIQLSGDGKVLTPEDIANIKNIRCGGRNIKDLTGIEHFTALESLNCDENNITTLDTSKNPVLKTLSCRYNNIETLNISNNPELTELHCRNNALTELDTSKNPALEKLCCNFNALTKLDIKSNVALKTLYCNNNALKSLDVSSNPELETFYYNNNAPDFALVAHFPDKMFRRFVENHYGKDGVLIPKDMENVKEMDCSGRGIKDLTGIEYFTSLEKLDCGYNQLKTLDTSNNTNLKWLYCGWNNLYDLDVSNNTALENLDCANNYLAALDISHNIAIKELYCYNNELTTLDISKNPALRRLEYSDNAPDFKLVTEPEKSQKNPYLTDSVDSFDERVKRATANRREDAKDKTINKDSRNQKTINDVAIK